ncbi:DUF3019 domain-containing protein [Shewanella sp.]|uniref:DUF3019 domain-containing protein n=1 Tax=Shewanella sp. TaxID=50422 RepID=UPI003566741D
MKYLVILSLLLLHLSSAAGELKVVPHACATSSDKLPCRFDVHVSYQGDKAQNLCLWLSHEAIPRRCYTGLKALNEQLSLALERDTMLEIRDMNSRILMRTEISVALYQPAPKRKRRGLNWDLL